MDVNSGGQVRGGAVVAEMHTKGGMQWIQMCGKRGCSGVCKWGGCSVG